MELHILIIIFIIIIRIIPCISTYMIQSNLLLKSEGIEMVDYEGVAASMGIAPE